MLPVSSFEIFWEKIIATCVSIQLHTFKKQFNVTPVDMLCTGGHWNHTLWFLPVVVMIYIGVMFEIERAFFELVLDVVVWINNTRIRVSNVQSLANIGDIIFVSTSFEVLWKVPALR